MKFRLVNLTKRPVYLVLEGRPVSLAALGGTDVECSETTAKKLERFGVLRFQRGIEEPAITAASDKSSTRPKLSARKRDEAVESAATEQAIDTAVIEAAAITSTGEQP